MFDDQDAGEKTESPTPRKRQDAREQGNVVTSRDVYSVCILVLSLYALKWFGNSMFEQMAVLMRTVFENLGKISITPATMSTYGWMLVFTFFKIIFPFMLVIMITGVVSGFLQHGFLFTLQPLIPNFSKLNIFNPKGLKSIFSPKSAVQLFFSIIKVAIISRIVYMSLSNAVSQIVVMPDMTVMQIFSTGCSLIFDMCIKIFMFLIVLAIADYAYQKWDHEKKLRMSKEEIKNEAKQFEGNPQIKARIRSIQMQMSRQRMMKDVPDADVIITNPIHYAVAVKYDAHNMKAPTVIAKGARLLAQRIKDVAIDNDVPIVENVPLAQALYKTVEVGQEVPEKLYQAVAEILAYVYQLNRGKLKDVMHKLSSANAI